ncbi:MAG: SDR family NAD(P)-dependent oxidoreductase [Thermoleophilaceae bacterium]|nr:SDR family NAD(P)-dependent oxidoreductase [Thermoleophilaceae bacterium]
MPESPSKAVLVTGCSSGIGRSTAELLAGKGWTVYASARKLDSISDLEARGCRLLEIDVTDEDSMRAAVTKVEEAEGAVGVLVNNAGYSQSGAVESVSPEDVRRQFDTNVFGLIRMTQLALPGMRRQRWGKVVNVGSMGGKLTFPGGGLYHATKYAVEAISDALRFEVASFGVDVILVEPGLIKTRFGETAAETVGGEQADGPYAEFNPAVAKATKEVYEGPLSRLGGGPEAVAETIERAVSRSRPRARYPVTPSARIMMAQRRLMPDRLWDKVMRTQFPRPGR